MDIVVDSRDLQLMLLYNFDTEVDCMDMLHLLLMIAEIDPACIEDQKVSWWRENIDIDMELLVYKYFGDIPALMLRKVIANNSQSQEVSVQENKASKILRSFRDISIRLDRLEHVLIN